VTVPNGLSRRSVLAGLGFAAAAACARPKGSSSARTATTTATTATTEPPTTAAPHVGPARFVDHGPAASKGVALTFHVSGDPAVCRQLFDEAKQLTVPLTLFLVGTWAQANPAQLKGLHAAGHELANHTMTHPTLGRLGSSAVEAEITGCRDLIRRETGETVRWFRPSAMEVPTPLVLTAAGAAGYDTVVGYNLDPHDYKDPGATSVAERVRNSVASGSIVSLHTAHAGTVSAFGDIVNAIRNAGLRPMTVSQMLAAR